MAWERTAIQGTLIIERGRDDAAAAPCSQLRQLSGWRWYSVAPLDQRTQGHSTVTCVDEYEDVPRREASDVAEPAVESQPVRGNVIGAARGIGWYQVSCLDDHIAELRGVGMAVSRKKHDQGCAVRGPARVER